MSARAPHVKVAHARIDISGHLDDCSLDELVVIRRCIERLEVLRAATTAGTAELGRPWSALDEALRLELTDVRMKGGADVQR